MWSMYYGMPVQQQYMEETVRIQNTEVVVGTVRIQQFGEFSAELRPYIYPRNIIYNVFLGSATISLFCFC